MQCCGDYTKTRDSQSLRKVRLSYSKDPLMYLEKRMVVILRVVPDGTSGNETFVLTLA